MLYNTIQLHISKNVSAGLPLFKCMQCKYVIDFYGISVLSILYKNHIEIGIRLSFKLLFLVQLEEKDISISLSLRRNTIFKTYCN